MFLISYKFWVDDALVLVLIPHICIYVGTHRKKKKQEQQYLQPSMLHIHLEFQ